MSTARGRDGASAASLEPAIPTLAARLTKSMRSGSHQFTSYRQKLLSKGAGKNPRVVAIATARDRIVLKSLSHVLVEVFPEAVPRTAQEKIDLLKLELKSTRFDAFVRVDIENFYGSISHAVIDKALARRVRKAEILSLIRSAITTPTSADGRPRGSIPPTQGVPQGLAISNGLAEISVLSIDQHYMGQKKIFYLRYVDDVIILCDRRRADSIFADVELRFREIDLRVHPLDKTNSKSSVGNLTSRFDYLGYEFDNGSVGVRRESLEKVENAVIRVLTRYRYQAAQAGKNVGEQSRLLSECLWKLNLVISGCTYRNTRRGWVAYFSQITDMKLLKRLDAMVARNLRRFALTTKLKPKTFVRSFWRFHHPTGSAYAPDFDHYSLDQKRDILEKVLAVPGSRSFTPTQVEQAFDSRIGKLVKDLDKHIGDVS